AGPRRNTFFTARVPGVEPMHMWPRYSVARFAFPLIGTLSVGAASGQTAQSAHPQVTERAVALMNAAALRLQRAKTLSATIRTTEVGGDHATTSTNTVELHARRPGDAVMHYT